MRTDGQAAVVTGGGSGLGAATARALAQAGAKVALLDVDTDGAEAVAQEIGGLAVRCDVASAESAERALATAREAHGVARIAVNCAGIGPAWLVVGKSGPHDLDDFRRVIEINLIGTFNVLRLAAADMKAADPLDDGERGVIVNTASIAGIEGQTGQAAYAASKGGVAALALPAARELSRSGIRVNTISPGLFGTPMLHGLPDKAQEFLSKGLVYPARTGMPEEFAALVVHIVGNVMLNGENIRLDGAVRLAAN